jgi:hypothetical protein
MAQVSAAVPLIFMPISVRVQPLFAKVAKMHLEFSGSASTH